MSIHTLIACSSADCFNCTFNLVNKYISERLSKVCAKCFDFLFLDENAERPETDDEGIERDSGDSDDDRMGNSRTFNFESILEVRVLNESVKIYFTQVNRT